jgi:hypothetical protein
MNAYATFCRDVASAANTPLILVSSDGTVRPHVYDIILGSNDTPADQAAEFTVQRNTTNGTGGTSVTPEPLDPLSVAASSVSTAGAYSTTNPTITANTEMLQISLNQRATFRWVASPGSELKAIATTTNGIIIEIQASTSTQGYEATMLFRE